MIKKLTITLLLAGLAMGASYEDAMELYYAKSYEKALEMLETVALNGDKRAQYQLGNIYEHGLANVEPNLKQAICYYKMVASEYNYCEVEPLAKDASILERLAAQQGSMTDHKMEHYLVNKHNANDAENKDALKQAVSSDFGLYAYKKNYFLPVSHADSKYPVWTESGMVPGETYQKTTEAEFQMSLKKPLSFDFFGWNETFAFAYTQQVWWQVYSNSGPFREVNFEPEFFMAIPTTQSVDEATGLKTVQLGLSHHSNGRDGLESRTWNRAYASTIWQHGNLFTNLRVWYRIPDPEDRDDNPDIHEYFGYGDLTLNYLYGKHQLGLMLRNNLEFGDDEKNRGAIQVDWSYPFLNAYSTYWYIKYFNGYGESLIDYNRKIEKTGFGLSFSRNVF